MAPSGNSSRTHQTLEFKYRCILEVEAGSKNKVVQEKYDVKPSTLSTWLKQRAAIKREYEAGKVNTKTMTLKAPKFPKTEAALVSWLQEAYGADLDTSGPIIKLKAAEFARKVGELGFCASNGWFERFNKRNEVVFKRKCGEGNAVDPNTVDNYRSTAGVTLPQRYSPEDIYNCDEAALVWQAQSGKTFTFKSNKAKGKKKPKQRVTMLVCANMTGTDKKKLMVIGKARTPRAFRGREKRVPVEWRWNDNAWMTSEFFTEWLIKWNRKLSMKGRKIALILDNATCHPKLELSNIELEFLPANTTSHLQPLDQGIIANIKVKYRHLYAVGHLIPALDEGRKPDFNIFDATEVLTQAWDLVTARTIARCFRKAGFKHPDSYEPTLEELEEEELPLAQLSQRLTNAGIPCDAAAAREALTEDEGLQTSAVRSTEEIVGDVLNPQADEGSDSEEEGDDSSTDPLPVRPTYREFMQAIDALKVIRNYASFNEGQDVDEMYDLSLKLHSLGIRHEPKKRQTTLHNFFS